MKLHALPALFLSALVLVALPRAGHGAAAIASAHPLATDAGLQVLDQGGNAFDAAVAVTATLAVVEPTGSGLGGGGFWLLYDAANDRELMLDGRETAPGQAHRDMYLDAAGEVIPNLSVDGPLAAGIPGEPAAIAWLASVLGDLPLEQSLAPAIAYAERGFAVGEHYQRLMEFRQPVIAASPAAAAIFLDDGAVPEPGWRLVQRDLGQVLRAIAERGFDGFYRGPVAEALVSGSTEAGGIWTLEDLAGYRVAVREPVRGSYGDMTFTAAALPSSGGLVMAEVFNILQGLDLESADPVTRNHLLVEAMRRAYRDRAEFMGDSDFVDVPVEKLLSMEHAETMRAGIDPARATPSADLAPASGGTGAGADTTHFSIVDQYGNRVAATLSINYPFGSGFVPPGTGVLLNDEMDDFSAKPGVPNVYGLVGAEANAIAPGKRMLSSMTPTFLETPERIAVLGTPGGSRIISMVIQSALAFHAGADAVEMVDRGRIHHQYLPDRIQYETGALTPGEVVRLYLRGHALEPRDRTWGNMHAVVIDKATGSLSAASDRRGEGKAAVIGSAVPAE